MKTGTLNIFVKLAITFTELMAINNSKSILPIFQSIKNQVLYPKSFSAAVLNLSRTGLNFNMKRFRYSTSFVTIWVSLVRVLCTGHFLAISIILFFWSSVRLPSSFISNEKVSILAPSSSQCSQSIA